MSFWSSQTLERRIGELLDEPGFANIDCNALQLRIGREIYVTPNLAEANTHTKRQLTDDEPFVIPPGQFAFLLTEEIISVPPDAMALISMRATYKMKGLINVSGFHVDPGWKGRLIFAVFNAGPQPVHLQRGLQLFLIWYSSLDAISDKRKHDIGPTSISPSTINNLTGGSDSLFELKEKLETEVKNLEDKNDALTARMHKLDISFVRFTAACASLTAICIFLGGIAFKFSNPTQLYFNPSIEKSVESTPQIQSSLMNERSSAPKNFSAVRPTSAASSVGLKP